jgi:CRISPR-associated protein Cas2
MRRNYIAAYDISDPKRLTEVRKIVKGFGISWQYSLFYCFLKDSDVVKLLAMIEKVINSKEDSFLILDFGRDPDGALDQLTVLGVPLPISRRGIVVL